MAQVGRKKGGKNKPKNESGQLLLDLFPVGRPKGSRNKNNKDVRIKPMSAPSGLRLKEYNNVPSSEGGLVSGISDQYGRIMQHYVNEKNEWDIRPSGHCIAARH
jgi:hypothetical protein